MSDVRKCPVPLCVTEQSSDCDEYDMFIHVHKMHTAAEIDANSGAIRDAGICSCTSCHALADHDRGMSHSKTSDTTAIDPTRRPSDSGSHSPSESDSSELAINELSELTS